MHTAELRICIRSTNKIDSLLLLIILVDLFFHMYVFHHKPTR